MVDLTPIARLDHCRLYVFRLTAEQNGRVSCAIRERYQLSLVPLHVNNLIYHQDRRFQKQTAEGSSASC